MTLDELDRLAYAGAEPPDDLTYEQEAYYLVVWAAYALVDEARLTPAQGAEMKRRARAVYDRQTNLTGFLARMWLRMEPARKKYFAERTLENADGFISAAYGVFEKEGQK